MRLLFDLTPLQTTTFSETNHGGGKYTKVVFNRILKDSINNKILFVYDKNKIIEEEIINQCEEYGHSVQSINNKYDIAPLISKNRVDRFYSALAADYYDLKLNDVQFYFTIHGPRPIELPFDNYEIYYNTGMNENLKYYYRKYFTSRFIESIKDRYIQLFKVSKYTDYVAVSEHTKYSMTRIFPELEFSETQVLFSPLYINEVSSLKNYNLFSKYYIEPDSYYLMVSGNIWVKNCLRAAEAFDELVSSHHLNKKLVITGVKNRNIYNRIKNKDKLVLIDYVENDLLTLLYKNAYAFIYPSLNEGFGYPPIEAMKCGLRSAVSGTSSIPEICGDAVLYFNPLNKEEMKIRILQLLDNKKIIPDETLNIRYNRVIKRQDDDLNKLINWILK